MKLPRKKSTQRMVLALNSFLHRPSAAARTELAEAATVYKRRTRVKLMPAHAALVAVLISASAAQAQSSSRSFYDKNGSFAGSSSTYNAGKNTSAYDRNGSFAGSAIRNSNGTSSFYDKNGHFTGSSVNTSRPK